MIIGIKDTPHAIILTDDRRTPSVALKSVEAQRRVDFTTKMIVLPKSTLKVFSVGETVYLSDNKDLFQIEAAEVGYSGADDLLQFIAGAINGQGQADYYLTALSGIAKLLQENNELLKNILC